MFGKISWREGKIHGVNVVSDHSPVALPYATSDVTKFSVVRQLRLFRDIQNIAFSLCENVKTTYARIDALFAFHSVELDR